MQIAVIGTGNVGGTIGARWAAAGHAVIFGVRDPESARARAALVAAGANARLATVADAVSQARAVVFAIPGATMGAAVADVGAALDGKVVIDASNQFGQPVMNEIAAIQAAAPGATVYRAFNSIGAENFAAPIIGGVQADLLYAGPEGEGGALVERLIADTGLRPIRAGDLAQAGLIDALGALWGALAYGQHLGRRLAFKVLTSDAR